MADLHRLPHRLGDARPGRIDQRARRRARDEDARQVEQQRRVLVAARIQPGQRHQELAAAQVGIADQVEGGIGRDEAVLARSEPSRCAPQLRITLLDLGERRRRAVAGAGAGCGWVSSMVSSSSATGWPIAAQSGSASSRARRQRLAQRAAAATRRSVRAARSGAAAAAAPDCRARSGRIGRDAASPPWPLQQQRIADVVERRAVLAGRQRAAGGPGEILKRHRTSFRRAAVTSDPKRRAATAAPATGKCLKRYTKARRITKCDRSSQANRGSARVQCEAGRRRGCGKHIAVMCKIDVNCARGVKP